MAEDLTAPAPSQCDSHPEGFCDRMKTVTASVPMRPRTSGFRYPVIPRVLEARHRKPLSPCRAKGTVVDTMLLGVMSDTHDEIVQAEKAVARFNREGVERVLHAGDFVSPFMIDVFRKLDAPFTAVFGNNDGDHPLLLQKAAAFPRMTIAGPFARADAGGMRIALLHGHDQALLETLAGSSSLDLIVHGHTHHAGIRNAGPILIVNPGEVFGHLHGRSTVALVDTMRRSAEIVEL